MTHPHHAANGIFLADVFFKHSIHPTGNRNALVVHGVYRFALVSLDFFGTESTFDPGVIKAPYF